jgi:hypothetical protein
MKHSKLPFKVVNNYTANLSLGDAKVNAIQDDLGRVVAITLPTMRSIEQHDNADFLVKACNEHDTLKTRVYAAELENIALRGAEAAAVGEINHYKAKAELFDELVGHVERLVASSPNWYQPGKEQLIKALRKAKELK